jgi:hypothetical protein
VDCTGVTKSFSLGPIKVAVASAPAVFVCRLAAGRALTPTWTPIPWPNGKAQAFLRLNAEASQSDAPMLPSRGARR